MYEFLFDVTLRRAQVELVSGFVSAAQRGQSQVHQLIMGAGEFDHPAAPFRLYSLLVMFSALTS